MDLLNSTEFERLRRVEFSRLEGTAYFNCASIGPLPERTRAAVVELVEERRDPGRLSDERLAAILKRARSAAARLVNAKPQEIALTTNTSYGLNLAATSLPLERGDVVLVPHEEFPANVYPWRNLERRGVVCERVPVTEEGFVDEERLLVRLENPSVRLLAVSLVQFSNGYLIDLETLSRACRANDVWLVLDAIQGLGQIPMDLDRHRVDILSCGGQKWLLSPWGSGFVYVREELVPQLSPSFVGWMAFEGMEHFSKLTDYGTALLPDARRFELVTLPFQDLLGFSVSVDLLLEVGIDRIRKHVRTLARRLEQGARQSGWVVRSPAGESRASGIVSLAGADLESVWAELRGRGVVCSVRERSLRFSIHCYNTEEEVDAVLELLGR